MKFPVAIQVYSVRDAAETNLYGTLKELKKMGYDGVEFAGLHGHTAEEVRDMCQDIGLVPISAHVAISEIMEDIDGVLNQYKTIGCQYIAVPYLQEDDRPGGKNFGKTVENMKVIAAAAKKIGIQLLYHNHDFEFVEIDGKYGLDVLYDTIPADLLQTELDTCWVNVGGANPAEYLRKYSGRAPLVHLKDFVGEKTADMYELIGIERGPVQASEKFELRPVGSGKQDFSAILKAAEEAGTVWVVVEQDNPSMNLNPMECAAVSRDYLKSIGC